MRVSLRLDKNKQKTHNAHPSRSYLLSLIKMRFMYQGYIPRSIYSVWYVRDVTPQYPPSLHRTPSPKNKTRLITQLS